MALGCSLGLEWLLQGFIAKNGHDKALTHKHNLNLIIVKGNH
jgi:hypothetical protein